MTLTDGRGELYQWDTGRTLTVDDVTVTQVHFQNRAYGRTIDVDAKDGTAIIPDELLQKAGELRVYAFSGTAESGFTKVERVFNIVRRNKPNDYMYTPTEQKSLEGLQKQIGDLSDLKTDAKTDIVAAINETATAGQTLGLTGATVGQVPAVKAVDGDGKPTEWEAVELPSGAYIVNLTMDVDGNITADKTFAEIKAAYDAGKVVNAKLESTIVPLCDLTDLAALFAQTNANSFKVLTAELKCTSDNIWSMSQNGFDAHTLGISGASVGQIVKIKTVDSSGVPTEWEPADMPSGGGGTDTSLGVTGATVGQTVKIKAVDENGVPTEWEAADMTSGGSGDEWEMIADITTDGNTSVFTFTGLSYREIIVDFWFSGTFSTGSAYTTFSVNGVGCRVARMIRTNSSPAFRFRVELFDGVMFEHEIYGSMGGATNVESAWTMCEGSEKINTFVIGANLNYAFDAGSRIKIRGRK